MTTPVGYTRKETVSPELRQREDCCQTGWSIPRIPLGSPPARMLDGFARLTGSLLDLRGVTGLLSYSTEVEIKGKRCLFRMRLN